MRKRSTLVLSLLVATSVVAAFARCADDGDGGDGGDGDIDGDVDGDGDGDVDGDVDGDGDGDATPGGAPCDNEADLGVIASIDVNAESNTCGATCAFDAEPWSCSNSCIVDATGLSDGCSACYSDSVICTVDNCLALCMDPSNPGCNPCREEHCMPAFWECSGLDAEAQGGEA